MRRRDFVRLGACAGLAGLAGCGRPPRSEAAAFPTAAASGEPDATLWLNWNENPAGLSPAARAAAVEAVGSGHRYPDAARDELIGVLAASHGVAPESLVLGCGSTEILQIVVQAAAAPGATLVLADPTFEAVRRYQRPHAYRIEAVALDGRWAHDLERMQATAARAPGPVVVYLCNPNNPTATLTPSAGIDAWIAAAPEELFFAVDEAYHDYVEVPGYHSAIRWTRERPNVVVTRTFSKIYAMAGLRLGYAVAHPETARRLRALRANDNANAVVLAAALASLRDPEHVPRSRASNREARRITLEALDELGLDHLPTHASFLMHEVPGELTTYIDRMREAGIRVGRPFPALGGYNRLSLGLPEEMSRFSDVLRSFRARGWV